MYTGELFLHVNLILDSYTSRGDVLKREVKPDEHVNKTLNNSYEKKWKKQ
jgi:hypothetical protein